MLMSVFFCIKNKHWFSFRKTLKPIFHLNFYSKRFFRQRNKKETIPNSAVNHWPMRPVKSEFLWNLAHFTSVDAIMSVQQCPYWFGHFSVISSWIHLFFPPCSFGRRFCVCIFFFHFLSFFSCHLCAQSNVLNCENICILSILCNRLACWKKQQLKNEIFA